jgi:predicted kinase
MIKKGKIMSKLILCCGKIASGKTHFCSQVKNKKNYFVFNTDEWMIHFYGESPDCSVFHERLEKCTDLMYTIASDLLNKDINVVLDFGFWTAKERKKCLDYFEKMNPNSKRIILYFPIDDIKQRSYLDKRQKKMPEASFYFSDEKLLFFNEKFETPTEKEVILIEDFTKTSI